MFDAFTKNLATTSADTYKIGKQFTSLSRMYTADEYGSETGMYQQDNVTDIQTVYRHIKVTKVETHFIWFEYAYYHATRYGTGGCPVINGISRGKGELCLLLTDLNNNWTLE